MEALETVAADEGRGVPEKLLAEVIAGDVAEDEKRLLAPLEVGSPGEAVWAGVLISPGLPEDDGAALSDVDELDGAGDAEFPVLAGTPDDCTDELLEKPVDATEETSAGLDTATMPDVEAVLLVASDAGLLEGNPDVGITEVSCPVDDPDGEVVDSPEDEPDGEVVDSPEDDPDGEVVDSPADAELVADNEAPELLTTGKEERDGNPPPEDRTTDVDCVPDPETPEDVGEATALVIVPPDAVMGCPLEDGVALELLDGRSVALMYVSKSPSATSGATTENWVQRPVEIS